MAPEALDILWPEIKPSVEEQIKKYINTILENATIVNFAKRLFNVWGNIRGGCEKVRGTGVQTGGHLRDPLRRQLPRQPSRRARARESGPGPCPPARRKVIKLTLCPQESTRETLDEQPNHGRPRRKKTNMIRKSRPPLPPSS
ncbi:hypothetical protein YQE_02621, partial [Dendroctonus ponderosae]